MFITNRRGIFALIRVELNILGSLMLVHWDKVKSQMNNYGYDCSSFITIALNIASSPSIQLDKN